MVSICLQEFCCSFVKGVIKTYRTKLMDSFRLGSLRYKAKEGGV